MSEAAYAAMREFIKVAVELEVAKARTEVPNELRTLRDEMAFLRNQLETRTAPCAVEPVVDVEAIATRAAQLVPAPKDGVDGKDGRDGIDGKDGIGKDGRDGKDGERGTDGIATRAEIESLVNTAVETRYADVVVRSIADSYQDVFKQGETYSRGAFATWDGSLWLSMRDTKAQPGTQDSGWKLVTKRGRDGRDKR